MGIGRKKEDFRDREFWGLENWRRDKAIHMTRTRTRRQT
jgi:hypothetical protein